MDRHRSSVRRRRLLVSLFVCALSFLVAGGVAPDDAEAAPSTAWTFGLYVNADNDLDYAWQRFTLPALRQIPAGSGLRVLVLLDRHGTWGAQLLEISGGRVTTLATLPEPDMGRWTTFRWFLQELRRRAPADHVAVCGWDHGYAWRYFSLDERSGSRISMPGLARAIRQAGLKIDILGFDACNMAALEVAYQASATGLVDYLVASEETVDQDGFPYGMMLAPLAADPGRSAEQVVRDMVRGWESYYRPLRWSTWVSLSALDIRRLPAMRAALQAWTGRLRTLTPRLRTALRSALARTFHAWDSDQIDVIDLCRQIEARSDLDDRILRRRTRTVRGLLQGTVVAVANGSVARHFQGMTIWWPDGRGWRSERARYRSTAFAGQSGWARFLARYCSRKTTAPALIDPHAPFGLCWVGRVGSTRLALGYDNDTALAIALRSTHGGRAWRQTSRGSWSYALYAASAATSRRWVACGGDGLDLKSVILVSSDGGRTWRRRPVASARYLFDVEMVDARTGWIVGSAGALLHTTTGGRDAGVREVGESAAGARTSNPAWKKMRSGTSAWLYGVEFLDGDHGWLVGTLPPDGDGVILQTSSGGLDPDGDGPRTAWRRIPSPAPGGLFDLALRPSGHAWAVGGSPAGGGGAIVHSTDGAHWTAQNAGTGHCLYSVCFVDDRHGWAVGEAGTILHSDDGGSSWARQASPAGFDLYHVEFTDRRHGTAVGDAAVMLVTDDGGITWRSRRVVRR